MVELVSEKIQKKENCFINENSIFTSVKLLLYQTFCYEWKCYCRNESIFEALSLINRQFLLFKMGIIKHTFLLILQSFDENSYIMLL